MKPTEEQLKDPKWWDENAPSGAEVFIDRAYFSKWIDGTEHEWYPGEDIEWKKKRGLLNYSLDEYFKKPGEWDVIPRPTTPPAPEWTKESQAVKTLESMGYTYLGGEYWKPPLGEKPDWIDWNGEGLPPVGVECECMRHGLWVKCEVRAHGEDHACPVAFVQTEFDCQVLDERMFRPIRTKEQRGREELAEALSKAAYRMGFALDLEESDAFADAVLAWLKERPQ